LTSRSRRTHRFRARHLTFRRAPSSNLGGTAKRPGPAHHDPNSEELTMESNNGTPDRLSPEAALAGVLALLIEDREARPSGARHASVEALLARAGLTSGEIGLATGQDSDAVDAHLSETAEGPALWRTLQRQRAAVAAG
jgi:hypothetical protein